MTLYCGIDLHGNNSLISLIDDNDRIVSGLTGTVYLISRYKLFD